MTHTTSLGRLRGGSSIRHGRGGLVLHFSGAALLLLLLAGCAGTGQPKDTLPATFGGLEKVQVTMMGDMGAAERFCVERLGEDTEAAYDCYDYAKLVCFDKNTTQDPKEPLRGDCTQRMESYGLGD